MEYLPAQVKLLILGEFMYPYQLCGVFFFSSKLLYVHLFIVFFTVSIITESKVACRPPVVMAMRVTRVWLHHLSIKSLEHVDGLYCKHLFLEQH